MSRNEELRSQLFRLIELIDYCDRISSLPDCNTCEKQNTCGHCPKPGEQVRINCFAYEGEEKAK